MSHPSRTETQFSLLWFHYVPNSDSTTCQTAKHPFGCLVCSGIVAGYTVFQQHPIQGLRHSLLWFHYMPNSQTHPAALPHPSRTETQSAVIPLHAKQPNTSCSIVPSFKEWDTVSPAVILLQIKLGGNRLWRWRLTASSERLDYWWCSIWITRRRSQQFWLLHTDAALSVELSYIHVLNDGNDIYIVLNVQCCVHIFLKCKY